MLFSVQGGHLHISAQPFERSQGWRPRASLCGRVLTPLNYFESTEDANKYCGGRLTAWLCKHCAKAQEAAA